jgi:outer membrane protein
MFHYLRFTIYDLRSDDPRTAFYSKEQYKKVMKNFRIFAAALMLAAILAVSASAQTRPAGTTPARPAGTTPAPAASNAPVPDTKIAFINTEAFGDEKAGITRYVTAMKSLEREFKPRQDELNTMQTRIRTIAEEISKTQAVADPKTIQAKQEEGEGLQRDLKYKKERADADFAKRYQEVVGPISQDIGKALDAFATQRGITMIMDISKLIPAILTVNPAMDVTASFISEYNGRNPATAGAR